MNELSKTSTWEDHLNTREACIREGKAALNEIERGTQRLRQVVSCWVKFDLGTPASLAIELGKKTNYIRSVVSQCRTIGMLPPATGQGRRSDDASQLPVENSEAMNELLPTSRAVRKFAVAPVEVKEQVITIANEMPKEITPDYNDRVVEHVASLIDENYNIDTSSLTDEDKDNCLKTMSSRINAHTAHAAMNEQMLEFITTKYCYWRDGGWDEHPPLVVITTLLPELTTDERQQLIDILLNPISI